MTAPAIRTASFEPYEVMAYRTRTGEVVKRIPISGVPGWELGLNLMGSWSADVNLDPEYITKDELNGIAEEWDFSWLVCQGMHIWQAGPLQGEVYGGGNTTRFQGVGIWALLTDKRVLAHPTRAVRSSVVTTDSDIAFGTGVISPNSVPIPALNQNLNLRGIANRLLTLMIAEPGGDLPIDIATGGIFTGTSEREFLASSLSSWGKRLIEMSAVLNGPEMMFLPYFTSPQRRLVRHQFVSGNPRLGQLGYLHVWDTAQGQVSVTFSKGNPDKTRRAWQRGSGMERNVLTGFAEDLTGVTTGPTSGTLPLLETANTDHSDVQLSQTLLDYANADVDTGKRANIELTVTVTITGDDGSGAGSRSPRLDAVTPGDTALLVVRNHPRLPDGNYNIRVIRMRGAGNVTGTLDVQVLGWSPL